jgi:hypothetical protein
MDQGKLKQIEDRIEKDQMEATERDLAKSKGELPLIKSRQLPAVPPMVSPEITPESTPLQPPTERLKKKKRANNPEVSPE